MSNADKKQSAMAENADDKMDCKKNYIKLHLVDVTNAANEEALERQWPEVVEQHKELFDKGYTAYFHVKDTAMKEILKLAKRFGFTPGDEDTNIALAEVEV